MLLKCGRIWMMHVPSNDIRFVDGVANEEIQHRMNCSLEIMPPTKLRILTIKI